MSTPTPFSMHGFNSYVEDLLCFNDVREYQDFWNEAWGFTNGHPAKVSPGGNNWIDQVRACWPQEALQFEEMGADALDALIRVGLSKRGNSPTVFIMLATRLRMLRQEQTALNGGVVPERYE